MDGGQMAKITTDGGNTRWGWWATGGMAAGRGPAGSRCGGMGEGGLDVVKGERVFVSGRDRC